MTQPLPDTPISPQGLRQLEAWIKRRQPPDEPDRWYYVHPLSPASTPPDHRVSEPHPLFESPWGNSASGVFATAFGKRKQGLHEKLLLRLSITGGEDQTNSLIFTLPEAFRPLKQFPFLARVGDDGAAAIDVNPDGTVVFVGLIAGTGTGTTAGIRYDIANTGDWLQVEATGVNPDAFDVGVNANWSIALHGEEVGIGASDSLYLVAPNVFVQSEEGFVSLALGTSGLLQWTGGSANLTPAGDVTWSLAASKEFGVFASTGGDVTLFANLTGFVVNDGTVQVKLNTGDQFQVKNSGGTPFFVADEATNGIQTKPPASSASTLALGTAYQNTLGYDILLNVVLNITANVSGVIKLGVGPTNTPTQQTIATGVTSTGFLTVPIYLPDQYYALLSTTGTVTLTVAGQNAMAV